MKIKWSSRFKKSYEKESLPMKGLIQGALYDFQNRYASNSKDVIKAYDRIEAVKYIHPIIEMKVSGGNRMIGCWKEQTLILIDVGDHETVKNVKRFDVDFQVRIANDAPDDFYLSKRSLFIRIPSLGYQPYANELLPEWHYFLDSEQNEIADQIIKSGMNVLTDENTYSLHFLIGGPGTGKTIILLNILQFFANDRYTIKLVISEQLQNYLQSCLPMIDLEPFVNGVEDPDILLVDDPDYSSVIHTFSKQAKDGNCKLVVIAFDLLQLNDSFSDYDLSNLEDEMGAITHNLKSCYRQKENVGKQAKAIADVIGKATPFLDKKKISNFYKEHKNLTNLSNNLLFPNRFGHSSGFIPNATRQNIKEELNRIKNQPGGLWSHYAPLLISIVDEQIKELPNWFLEELNSSGIKYSMILFRQLNRVC